MGAIEDSLRDGKRRAASSGEVVGAGRANEVDQPREDAPELERDGEEGADDGVVSRGRRS